MRSKVSKYSVDEEKYLPEEMSSAGDDQISLWIPLFDKP